MIFYGLDPGVTTGYAKVRIEEDREWHIEDVAHWNQERTMTFLHLLNTDRSEWRLIVEDYIISPRIHGHSHEGDKGIALRIIGAAELVKVEFPERVEFQLPLRKPTGYGFVGRKYERGKKGQHMWDALSHVGYYVVTHGFAEPIEPLKKPAPVSPKKSTPRIFHTQSHSQWRRPDK